MLSSSFSEEGLYYVDSDEKGFNEYRFYEGKFIEDWPEGILFVFDGAPEQDFLMDGLHWRLVSERVRQVFLKHNIPGVQFLPVKAVHKQTGKELSLGPYWVLNVYQSVNSLKDWQYVQNFDIFRRSVTIFISRRLKQLLEEEKVTSGAGFEPMSDYVLGIKEEAGEDKREKK